MASQNAPPWGWVSGLTEVRVGWALQRSRLWTFVSFGEAGSSWWAVVTVTKVYGSDGFCPSLCGSWCGTRVSACEGILRGGKGEGRCSRTALHVQEIHYNRESVMFLITTELTLPEPLYIFLCHSCCKSRQLLVFYDLSCQQIARDDMSGKWNSIML